MCLGVSWFQLFLHIRNRDIKNIIFILATTAKKCKKGEGIDTVAMNGLKFFFYQCVCSCVSASDIRPVFFAQ